MRRTDIKPGMVLAWKAPYTARAVKATVVGPGETEGSKYSFQGPSSRPGWVVTVDPDLLTMKQPHRSSQSTDTEGNYVALGRDLLGDWADYQAKEAAEIAERQATRDEQEARDAAEKQATIDLKALLKRYGVLDDSWVGQRWPSSIDILASFQAVVKTVTDEMY
jgi:hypothetical protein